LSNIILKFALFRSEQFISLSLHYVETRVGMQTTMEFMLYYISASQNNNVQVCKQPNIKI